MVAQFREVVQGCGHRGNAPAEGLLVDRQRALKKRLGLSIVAPGAVQCGEVAQGCGPRRDIGPHRLLVDYQCAIEKQFGLFVLALVAMQHGKGVEARGQSGIIWA